MNNFQAFLAHLNSEEKIPRTPLSRVPLNTCFEKVRTPAYYATE